MDSVVNYGAAGQHVELSRLSESLVVPLKAGLSSFITVSGILLSINADMLLPGSQDFEDIRRQIENMTRWLEEAEQIANTELQRVDTTTEALTLQHSQLAEQKKQKTNELNNLNSWLRSYQSNLNTYQKALATAERNERSAHNTVYAMRRRWAQAQLSRDIGRQVSRFSGFGGFLVPFSEAEMRRASDAAREAFDEVLRIRRLVRHYSQQISHYNSLIHQTRRDIAAADGKIRETGAKLQDLSARRRVVADIQDKIRRAVTQLGQMRGVGSVAELQTRRLILLEPVMKVLEEMTTILGQISDNDLMNRKGVLSLMEEMKRNHSKLKGLADTNKSGEDLYI